MHLLWETSGNTDEYRYFSKHTEKAGSTHEGMNRYSVRAT